MRILFVNRMASILRGGGETFDLEVAKGLEKLGCEISFLSGLPLFGQARSAIDFERSYTLRTPYTGDVFWDKCRGGWRIWNADIWIFEKRALAWARERVDQFDIIQLCELPQFVSDWKKQKQETPIVMRMTSPIYHDKVNGIQEADALIASGTTMEAMRDGIREDCIDIPNGVDVERFKPGPSDFREQVGVGPDDIMVLFVARLILVKNHAMLLKAFRTFAQTVPRAKLVLVGDGMFRDSLKSTCRKFGIEDLVVFLGEVPFDQVPDIYRTADIKVISSDYESFSFTTLEAMASGLPLVVTRTQWVPRLVGDGEGGLVVEPGDADGFAQALITLAKDPAQRERMGTRNREVAVHEYGWAASARKLLDVYERWAHA